MGKLVGLLVTSGDTLGLSVTTGDALGLSVSLVDVGDALGKVSYSSVELLIIYLSKTVT